MMRRTQREFNPSAIEQASQRNWNEAWGTYRSQRNILAAVTVGALCLTGLIEVRSWSHDTEPKMIPYVINRNGPSLVTARLELQIPDAARIEAHLHDWVEDWRTVTSDPLQQKHKYDHVFDTTDASSIGHDQLVEWYRANDPRKRAEKNTVDIDVGSVVSDGGEGWLVNWSETSYAREAGKAITKTFWRATFTVHIKMPTTEDEFLADWDGVFITSFHVKELPGPNS